MIGNLDHPPDQPGQPLTHDAVDRDSSRISTEQPSQAKFIDMFTDNNKLYQFIQGLRPDKTVFPGSWPVCILSATLITLFVAR